MRTLISAAVLAASLSSPALAGPKEEALQVLDKWAKAFSDSDVDAIVKLYAPDALFLGTASKTVVTRPEGIRAYFENALLNNRPRGAKLDSYEARVLSDTAVVVTGLDTLTGVRDGKPFSTNGRDTFVLQKRGADGRSCISTARRCRADLHPARAASATVRTGSGRVTSGSPLPCAPKSAANVGARECARRRASGAPRPRPP